jgi:hypothetical protein
VDVELAWTWSLLVSLLIKNKNKEEKIFLWYGWGYLTLYDVFPQT